MEIMIQINDGEKQSQLQMKGASQQSEIAVLRGFFQTLGVKNEVGQKVTPKTETISSSTKSGSVAGAGKIAKTKVAESAETKDGSKQLPLLGSENRASMPIGEVAKIKSDQPEHWATGIKTDPDGTKRYKCRYWCNCGNQSNHYVRLDDEFTTCHECGTEIAVEEATFHKDENGVPERDDFGNFFVARG